MTTTFRTATSYNEDLLAGLDFLLAEMGKRDMKAVIFLNNFWEWSGGMVTYQYWTNGGRYMDLGDPAHPWPEFADFSAQFYSSPKAVALYLNMSAICRQKEQLHGRPYRDDPTIMAWELANGTARRRPRGLCPSAFAGFLCLDSHSARFIKARDTNHLVTTGSEGLRGCLDIEDVVVEAHAIREVGII